MPKCKVVFKAGMGDKKKVIGETIISGDLENMDVYDVLYEIVRERGFYRHHFDISADVYFGSKDEKGSDVPLEYSFPRYVGLMGGTEKPGSADPTVAKRVAVITSGEFKHEVKLPTDLRSDPNMSDEDVLDRAMDYVMKNIESYAKNFPKGSVLSISVSSNKGLTAVRMYDPNVHENSSEDGSEQ